MRSKEQLVKMYDCDPASPYDMTLEELYVLKAEIGETEVIVDAILEVSGATNEQRAKELGMTLKEFLSYS